MSSKPGSSSNNVSPNTRLATSIPPSRNKAPIKNWKSYISV